MHCSKAPSSSSNLIRSSNRGCTYKALGLKCLKSEKQAMRDSDRESDRWANQVQHCEDTGNSVASLMGFNSLHSISMTVLQLFQFFYPRTHTHTCMWRHSQLVLTLSHCLSLLSRMMTSLGCIWYPSSLNDRLRPSNVTFIRYLQRDGIREKESQRGKVSPGSQSLPRAVQKGFSFEKLGISFTQNSSKTEEGWI